MLVPGKCQPGVDNDDVVVELVDGQVLADLADTAERDDPKRFSQPRGGLYCRPREGSAGWRAPAVQLRLAQALERGEFLRVAFPALPKAMLTVVLE